MVPLCDLELSREEVKKLHGRSDAADWWGEKIQLGRAPFDSKYCAVWHVVFGSFPPAERALALVCRFLIRPRGAKLRGEAVPDFRPVNQMAFDTAYVEDAPAVRAVDCAA